MVNLNISNVPTDLYYALKEVKAKIRADTWVDYLRWTVQDPEGEIDFEFLSIDGKTPDGKGHLNKKIVFRTGNFVYEFDGSKPKDEQYSLLRSLGEVATPRRSLQVIPHAKNPR